MAWPGVTLALSQFPQVSGCDEFSGGYSTLHFNHTLNDGFLALRYSDSHYVLPDLSDFCNFTLAEQQSGAYSELACLCKESYNKGGTKENYIIETGYKVALYGQNISADWLQCVENFLNENCDKLTTEDQNVLWILLSIWGLVFGCGCMMKCGSTEDKPELPEQSESKVSRLDKTSAFIGLVSAYGTGAIKGSQLYDSLGMLRIPNGNLPLLVRLLVLPLAPLINVTALHYTENRKVLSEITSIRSLYKGVSRQCRRQPVPTLLTGLAAVTEGMMVTNSILSLLGKSGASWVGLAAGLGLIDALQFVLLDGKSLSERLDEDFFYTSKKYTDHLASRSWIKANWVRLGVHLIPAVGALLYSVLAFLETKELIEEMTPSDNEDYRQDLGGIFGLPLALIYGGMQYSLYGFRTQKVVAEWLIGSPVHGHVEAKRVSCGSVGYLQNYWVEGYELMGIEHELVEEKEEPLLLEQSGTKYQFLPDFLSGLARIAALALSRLLIQKALMPDATTADEIDSKVTFFSYVLSGLASVVTWFAFELPRLRQPSLAPQIVQSEWLVERESDLFTQRRRLSSTASTRSVSRLGYPDRNDYEHRQQVKAQAERQFRHSWGRLAAQFVSQLLIPIIIGTLLESLFRRLFKDHSHLDSDQSLNNAQVLGALFTGLMAVIIGYAIDRSWGRRDRARLEQISWQDQQDQDDENKTSKNKLSDMAQGLKGYTYETFCKLIAAINQDPARIAPETEIKIVSILKFQATQIDRLFHLEMKAEEPVFSINLSTQFFPLPIKKEDENPTPDDEIKFSLSSLKNALQELKPNRCLLLPFCCAFNDRLLQYRNEYGFLHAVRDDKDVINLIYYSPVEASGQQYLRRWLRTELSMCDPLIIKWRYLETPTPVSAIESGAWVAMQIQALLRKQIDLSRDPYQLVRELNLSQVRLSQCSFLVASASNSSGKAVPQQQRTQFSVQSARSQYD